MSTSLQLSALRERLLSSLWFVPGLSVLGSLVAGLVLSSPGLGLEVRGSGLWFVGTPEGARAILSTVAGSMITVTGLTFSLTVVALQMASSQFTPRLLSTFLSDRGNQAVLSVFLSTFVYSLVVLRAVRSGTDALIPFVPSVAVALALVLTLLSVAMLVYFFHHLTQQLRVERVLEEVRADTLALVRSNFRREAGDHDGELPAVPGDAAVVRARRSGYLQMLQLDGLSEVAEEHGVVLRLRPEIGSHVTEGTTLAWVWRLDGTSLDLEEGLEGAINGRIHIGPDRTLRQDVAYGVRQLVDIAAKALSPGINDPTTAVAAIGAVSDVLCELAGCRLGPRLRRDERGRARVGVPNPTFAQILALACDQPRRYGESEPAVLTALLQMLTDIADVAAPEADLDAVGNEIRATLDRIEDVRLPSAERERVHAYANHAWAALKRGARVADVTDDADLPAT